MNTQNLIHRDVEEDEDAEHDNEGDDEVVVQKADQDQLKYILPLRLGLHKLLWRHYDDNEKNFGNKTDLYI